DSNGLTQAQRRILIWGFSIAAVLILVWLVSYDARFNPFADRYARGTQFKIHTGRGYLFIKFLKHSVPTYAYAFPIMLPLWIPPVIAWVVTARLARKHRRKIPPGHCGACGYNLAGLENPRCPECGRVLVHQDGRMLDPEEAVRQSGSAA